MNKIHAAFAQAANQDRGALIIYLTGGFPNIDESAALLRAASDAGADILEVGLPFSDPVADGPTIQAATKQALASGATTQKIIDMLSQITPTLTTPIVIMTAFNPIFTYGLEQFAANAAAAGVAGVLVADMPPSESARWSELARAHGLVTIFLLAPSTKPARFAEILNTTTGFVYVLARQGVTGERATLPAELPTLVASVKAQSDLPVAVGFGISTPAQVGEVCAICDGAIVGSAVVRSVLECDGAQSRIDAVRNTVASLATGCHIARSHS